MTLTVADEDLNRILEPGVCTTRRRYEVLKEFQRAGIPAVVWLTPVLPFLSDTEENLRAVLELCFDAGVRGIVWFGAGMTLREGDREYYYAALDRRFPGLSERYRRTYGNAYELLSPDHARLSRIFTEGCEQYGVIHDPEACFRFIAELPEQEPQLSLF